jgi:hypothetical protein
MIRFRHPRHVDAYVEEFGDQILVDLVVSGVLDEASQDVLEDWLQRCARTAWLKGLILWFRRVAAPVPSRMWPDMFGRGRPLIHRAAASPRIRRA